MNHHEKMHLNQDQILRAAIDPSDLSPGLQAHFAVCAKCQKGKDELEKTLERLGKAAMDHTPMSERPLAFPSKTVRPSFPPVYRRRLAMSTVLAGLIAALFIWGFDPEPSNPVRTADNKPMDVLLSDELVTEISMMLDNIIPPTYQEIAAESELYFDDSFVEFVMPIIDSNPTTYMHDQKGAKLC